MVGLATIGPYYGVTIISEIIPTVDLQKNSYLFFPLCFIGSKKLGQIPSPLPVPFYRCSHYAE